MKYTGRKFKLSAVALAVVSSSFSVFAQEDDLTDVEVKTQQGDVSEKDVKNAAEATSEDEVEIITVSGFRGSLLKSMLNKRGTGNVSDSIFAEDIGKSTDQNIADALSRVTGVSVQSEDGEGTRITVRGANPSQNMITLNGVQLTSSDFNQAVDLSSFSSDILSSITVVKTPSADHDEGSLGASIELKTTKPLDLNNDIRSVTVQGRYNDFSENANYKLAGSYSSKFFDDTAGFLITAFTETNSVRRDEIIVNDFVPTRIIAARDQNGNVVTDTVGIAPESLRYQLYENDRDRVGVNASFQILPTDTTNVVLDLNYSKFTGSDVFHAAVIRNVFPASLNYEEGVPSVERLNGQEFVPTFSDPHAEWTSVNTDTRTLTKQLRRFADGGYGRRNTSENTINKQASLRIEQEVTDTFRFEVGVNYSKTSLVPEPSFSVDLLSQGANPKQGRILAGPEGTPHTGIQPAGYDCTSGTCEMIFGDGKVSINNPANPFDNSSRSAWNPQDLNAHSVNNFNIFERRIDDEQKTAYIDFDWDVEFAGITQIEFGVKYRDRTKRTDDQRFDLNNTAKIVVVDRFDADGNLIGQQTLTEGQSLSEIPPSDFAFDGGFPYDNFLSSLGVSRNSVTNGWPLVSAEKLQEIALGIDNLELDPDPGLFREAFLEDQAAYLKFKYEYLDGKLTGDIGVRYIRTDSENEGSSRAQFAGDNALGRVFDPFFFRTLRDVTIDECQISGRPRTVAQYAGYNRIDGLGWDLTGDTPVRLPADPAGYPCHDPLTLRGGPGWFLNARHEDISRHPFYIFGDNATAEDQSLVTFATTGGNTYDMFLPSLNVNYQVGEDIISRFAVSKTISRPNIDSLRPGFNLNENFWSAHDQTSGFISLGNPNLLPQESKNLDISLEWYFNKTGLLSAAFFYKDLSNFEEAETAITYAEDLRYVDLTQPYDVGGLFLSEAEARAALQDPSLIDGVGKAACFPDRGNLLSLTLDWWFDESNDLLGWCSQFEATRLRNGKGAEIKGVELSYQQNYDFLPGVLSGLGTSVNYTYQDSQSDPESSSFNENEELPTLPQPFTPEHSYNATVFWEKDGHLIRLALRGKSDELVRRTFGTGGTIWREGTNVLDLSAAYKISDTMRISFQAINLTNENTRNYFTSRTLNLGDTQVIDGVESPIGYNEGNPLEDSSITKSRTQLLQTTGRTYRIDFRVDF